MGRGPPLKNHRTSAGLGLLHSRRRVSRRSTSSVLLAMTTGGARISVGQETEGEGPGHHLLPGPPHSQAGAWLDPGGAQPEWPRMGEEAGVILEAILKEAAIFM